MTKNKSKSSQRWLQRRDKDKYGKLAQDYSYRSRATFKLQDINKKYNFLPKAKTILDLGSCPGSWLQYIKQVASPYSTIIGIDMKEIDDISDVIVLRGDFTETAIQEKIMAHTNTKFDLICSDMAPETIGDKTTDHLRIMHLVESAFAFACRFQAAHGHLILKIFQGERAPILVKQLKQYYTRVGYFKPKTSHKDSSEIFIIAQNFKPTP